MSLQTNLHKSKVACAELLHNLERIGSDIANILYILSECNKHCKSSLSGKKSVQLYIYLNSSWDDLTVVAVKNGKHERLLLAFCYMPHYGKAPLVELWRVVDVADKTKRPLVKDVDPNAHHTVWGSGETQRKGWVFTKLYIDK